VRITEKREQAKDGTVTETRSVTFTQKKTYPQDWPAYNQAQTTEKHRFQVLLRDLCDGLEEPPQAGTGRRRTAIADIVFASVFKVYCGLSSRRFGTDLAEARAKGYIASPKMHPMMVCCFLEAEYLTPVLKRLIVQSALPLRCVETVFAPDSTGFSTSRHVRWFDEKYGCERSGRDWVKVHAICGTKTNVVTAVEIFDRHAADCPQLPALVKTTAEAGFNVREVPADKAYLSHDNLEVIAGLGAVPYIPFKSNSVEGDAGGVWEKMFRYYQYRRDEFMPHYHQRSNAESAFSMVKAKFGDSVKSKTETAMRNEALCKILAHNLCCLIQSQVELGIEPVFWSDEMSKAPVAEPEAVAAPIIDGKETVRQMEPFPEAPVAEGLARAFPTYSF
jgi:transposase